MLLHSGSTTSLSSSMAAREVGWHPKAGGTAASRKLQLTSSSSMGSLPPLLGGGGSGLTDSTISFASHVPLSPSATASASLPRAAIAQAERVVHRSALEQTLRKSASASLFGLPTNSYVLGDPTGFAQRHRTRRSDIDHLSELWMMPRTGAYAVTKMPKHAPLTPVLLPPLSAAKHAPDRPPRISPSASHRTVAMTIEAHRASRGYEPDTRLEEARRSLDAHMPPPHGSEVHAASSSLLSAASLPSESAATSLSQRRLPVY
jgi:hypothetical protein